MPVRLRLSLHGNRNSRIFHLVAIDLRKRRDAKPIELLGVYDPRLHLGQEHKTVRWSVERITYWLEKGGALPSKPVVKLLEWVRPLCSPLPTVHFRVSEAWRLNKGRHHSPKFQVSPKSATTNPRGCSFRRARRAAFTCVKKNTNFGRRRGSLSIQSS